MGTTRPTHDLGRSGVSIWLDDLSRSRLSSGSLAALVATHDVVGVTTNPAIFAAAPRCLDYGEALDALLRDGSDAPTR